MLKLDDITDLNNNKVGKGTTGGNKLDTVAN